MSKFGGKCEMSYTEGLGCKRSEVRKPMSNVKGRKLFTGHIPVLKGEEPSVRVYRQRSGFDV